MRHNFVLFAGSATALAVSVAVALPATAASATSRTSCAKLAGTATFVPGLSGTARPETDTVKGTLSGCTGGGVTGGKFRAVLKSTAQTCLSGKATGTLVITWNTAATSKVHETLGPANPPVPNHGTLTGKVTSGLFVGDTSSGAVVLTPTSGQNCFTVPVTSGKVANSGPVKF